MKTDCSVVLTVDHGVLSDPAFPGDRIALQEFCRTSTKVSATGAQKIKKLKICANLKKKVKMGSSMGHADNGNSDDEPSVKEGKQKENQNASKPTRKAEFG